ncbi:MAG: hypothetical protein LBT37_06525 [Lactobacillaceae bacterium]|jgi:hypothetical protein|nr:hypothetical protein [Lactobacillaceae bacterium]
MKTDMKNKILSDTLYKDSKKMSYNFLKRDRSFMAVMFDILFYLPLLISLYYMMSIGFNMAGQNNVISKIIEVIALLVVAVIPLLHIFDTVFGKPFGLSGFVQSANDDVSDGEMRSFFGEWLVILVVGILTLIVSLILFH